MGKFIWFWFPPPPFQNKIIEINFFAQPSVQEAMKERMVKRWLFFVYDFGVLLSLF